MCFDNMDEGFLLKRLKQIILYIRTSWNGVARFSKVTLTSGKSTSDVIMVIIPENSNILNEKRVTFFI